MTRASGVARSSIDDLYVEGDRAAVLVGEKVAVLSELATALVLAVPDGDPAGRSVAELAEHLVAVFGDPGDAEQITRATVEDLIALGVLRQVGEDA